MGAEVLQVKKRLHQEMTASSQKDQKLQELQRKFPTLLSELERTESRCNQLAKDKEELQQQLQALRREFQQYKEESALARKQDQKVKSSLEQNNQKVMNEVFTLNTRLTESVLLVSELRSKRERDQELMLREASRKAQLEQTIISLERENKELKNLLQSHNTANHPGNRYSEDSQRQHFQQEIDYLRSQILQQQERHQREISELQTATRNFINSPGATTPVIPNSPKIETAEERLAKQLDEERRKITELEEQLRRQSFEQQEREKSPEESPVKVTEEPESSSSGNFVHESADDHSEVSARSQTGESEKEEPVAKSSNSIMTVTPLRKHLYKPTKNDTTDQMVGKVIRSRMADGLELLPPNFSRIMAGLYQFGTRKIYISLQNNQPVVRVGGGYMMFPAFVKKYGRSECIKVQKHPEYAKLDGGQPISPSDNSILFS